jgi:hypothetical protein
MRRLLVAVVAVAAASFPWAAQAAVTQTFSTSQSEFDPGVRNQGWWSANSVVLNSDSNDNYIVDSEQRNFFSFDLSSACQASGVTLQLTRFDQFGTLTYSLFDVSTAAATLNTNDGASPTIFEDLGSGTSFGSFPVAAGAETDVLSFTLNAAGVAAFNAARGGFFSIGGSVAGASGYLFGFSGPPASGTQQLVVTCAAPTTRAECQSGGWRTYPDFKNQGQCVAFVLRGPTP